MLCNASFNDEITIGRFLRVGNESYKKQAYQKERLLWVTVLPFI